MPKKNTLLSLKGFIYVFVFCLLIFGSVVDSHAAVHMSESGVWGYSIAYRQFVYGDYLYSGAGRMVDVYDITTPGSPSKVSAIVLDEFVCDISASGNYLYVVTRKDLQIVDITTPASPSVVSTYNFNQTYDKYLTAVYASGSYAYVFCDNDGLHVMDVSTPSSPSQVGFLANTTWYGYDLEKKGDILYLAASSDGIRLIDVSTPSSPSDAGSITTSWYMQALEIDGNYAYIADGIGGILIYDVTNPGSPTQVGSYTDPYYEFEAMDLEYSNGYLYVVDRYWGNGTVFDVSTPSSPQKDGEVSVGYTPFYIAASGSYFYISEYDSGLVVVNATNSSSPVQSTSLQYPSGSARVVVSGQYAYVANENKGMLIVDVSTPSTPTQVNNYFSTAYAWMVDVSGSYAYVASGSDGLRIYDVSTPQSPSQVSSVSGDVYVVHVEGNYAYIFDSTQGFVIIDISTPSSPSVLGNCTWAVMGPSMFKINGTIAYAADCSNGIQVIDISNPNSPSIIRTITAGYANDLDIVGNYLYAADSFGYLRVFSISTPSYPVEVGNLSFSPQTCDSVAVRGTTAFVGTDGPYLKAIDVSTPSSPTEVDSLRATDGMPDIALAGDYAYIANSYCGFAIVDISYFDPTLNLTAPNGSEEWLATDTYSITWNSTYLPGNVNLDYSTDNGQNWTTIATNETNDGLFAWTLPNTESSTCLVKVTAQDVTLSDTSDATFSIVKPSITLTSPNGSETWIEDDVHAITWNTSYYTGNIKIEYTTDGSAWTTLESSYPDTGTYNWTIPAVDSSLCKVRVTALSAGISDLSDNNFTIQLKPTLVLDYPNGGESWKSNTYEVIRWTTTGSVGDLKIEISFNNGTDWQTIIASTPNDGNHTYTVAKLKSDLCLVRISEVSGSLTDTSDAVFSIRR